MSPFIVSFPLPEKEGVRGWFVRFMIAPALKKRLVDIYQHLYGAFGPQHWWPGDDTPFEVIVGAILTQSAAWANVEKALANLKREGVLKSALLRAIPQERLAELLYPSVYFKVKAKKVKAFVQHLGEKYNHDLARFFAQDIRSLRKELLGIYGIGEETADSIILYAAKESIFVVDAYTKRIFHRLGLASDKDSYTAYQEMFEANLPRDVDLFNEYHALLVRLGKDICRKEPLCRACPLREVCATGASLGKGAD